MTFKAAGLIKIGKYSAFRAPHHNLDFGKKPMRTIPGRRHRWLTISARIAGWSSNDEMRLIRVLLPKA
ncbi:MAG TPA: hypothetical protein VHE81_12665, partial [Lacipirellulaceae bacterium]|nr:hypothetical protein [Lacipirellulaceae bacterium]